jgi:succinate dehydrogenase assembly factor 1
MGRHSGLQLEVLALYRACLRMARSKPAATRGAFEAMARVEFRRHADVARSNTAAIEYLLRRGRRQLATLGAPGVLGLRYYDAGASRR